jgi:hypothetical protein
MLLVLGSWAMGCVAFGILGLLVLASVPGLRLTFLNLLLFVVGAFPGALACLIGYLQLFAGHELQDAAFVGLFPVLFAGASLGGALLVKLKIRFVKNRVRWTTNLVAVLPKTLDKVSRHTRV